MNGMKRNLQRIRYISVMVLLFKTRSIVWENSVFETGFKR